jgi:hypothetical protein
MKADREGFARTREQRLAQLRSERGEVARADKRL